MNPKTKALVVTYYLPFGNYQLLLVIQVQSLEIIQRIATAVNTRHKSGKRLCRQKALQEGQGDNVCNTVQFPFFSRTCAIQSKKLEPEITAG